jgi:RecA/RadA recombinase
LDTRPFHALDDVLAEIQQRWGQQALQPGSQLKQAGTPLPTGIRPLDELLKGGFPTASLSALYGTPTSGMTTLAYTTIAHTQTAGDEVVYLDVTRTINPAAAADCGVDLDRLLIVHPPDALTALEPLRDIIASRVVRLVVFDLAGDRSSLPLHRLRTSLHETGSVLLALTHHPLDAAQVRLRCERVAWLHEERDVIGCRVRATLEKHPTIPGGEAVTFDLPFTKAAGSC